MKPAEVPMGGGTAASARSTNKLTDRTVRAHIARVQAGTAATRKLADGGGLFLTLTKKKGTPAWRLKYRLAGRERLLAIGTYPEISLEAARGQRELARAQLREGKDPSQAKQLARLAAAVAGDNTFQHVAEAWLEKSRGDWSRVHYDKSRRAFERDVLPIIGRLPIREITAPMIAAVVRPVANRGARETAGRILQHIGGVFRYAEALGLVERDPSEAAREVLPRRGKTGRRAALLEVAALRDLLRRAELAPLSPSVRLAHRVCAFTVARVGNVVDMRWDELALEGADPSWTIPRARMKTRDRHHDHRILLSPTIAAELRAWRGVTGDGGYVLPSPTGNAHITREAIEKALRETLEMAGKHSPHGWRSSFSTLARDAGFSRDVVELTLDHVHDTATARAYDRGERLDERRKLMRWWDEQLTGG
jgi:integrase